MLKIYTIDHSNEWDSIVKTFDKYDVYYFSGYVKAFKLHGDGEPLLLSYEGNGLRGINVVMKRDIAEDIRFQGKIEKGRYYDLSTPYGYGGWLFEGEGTDESITIFNKEYDQWCKENNIVSEFIRFHPVINNAVGINEKIYDTVLLGKTVAIQLDDKDNIWARYTSRNRSHIRVATKEGVVVKKETSKAAFDQFREIYETTMTHDDAVSYYYFDEAFFESIRNDLEGHCKIFTAYLDDKAIASSIVIYAEKYLNYHLSGQLFEYRRYAGTNMILNEAANWGCENGFEWFHLGGGLGAKDGPLYEFKKSFYKKGDDQNFYIGRKIIDTSAYQLMISLREEGELGEGFFPKYRA